MKRAYTATGTRVVLRKDESGRTGLETAIVFACSILSAGHFRSERDKNTV
jgi:hypothetical protein